MKREHMPLYYATAACDTMIRKFKAQDLPPKGHFHYHQGVFLSGMYQTYLLCQDEKYFNYIKEWTDSVIDEKGNVKEYDPGQLDDIQPGILLFPLYERSGDEKYRKALDTLLPLVKNFPRNEVGGFWHKEMFPNQMWLDGLYMAGPISAEYAKRFGHPEYMDLAAEQALLMQKYTRDSRSGLWYHAWDSTGEAEWADPKTGLAPEFWGRSIGWVPVAILDELDFMDSSHPKYQELCDLVKNLLTAVCRYQSEDGRWYQVVDKGQEDGNWLENSCSCLFAAALCKAVRRGLMGAEYLETAQKGYEGVIRSLEWDGEDLLLGGVCIGTGVGDYAHYCARPVSVNDLHGMGAFLLMCAEVQRALDLPASMSRTEQIIMDGWEFTLREPVEGNFSPVTLPHDWAIDAPFNQRMEQGGSQGFRDRWGTGWYRRGLELTEKKEGFLYYLDFGGIYENSTVGVNGQEAGGRKYGYSSFRLDVTSFVKTGENEILIRVDNTASPADRWYSGCGIYRTVKWLELPERHLEDWEIAVHTSVRGGEGLVQVETGQQEQCAVKAVLRFGGLVYEAGSIDGTIEIAVPDAKLWSAEEPNLYALTVQLMDGDRVADEVTQRIGIREFQFDPGKGMLVNGSPVKLKGVCLHQEAGSRGIAVRQEIWRQRLAQLKEMGCNAIRAAHHTHSVEFLDLCDEMGFYVYEECFDKWTGGLYGRYFESEWKKDVEAMVKRDRNRACICIWGVGNEVENQAQDSMLAILSMLRDYVLTMDVTRPVSYAMNPHFKRESNIDVSKIKDIQKFVDEADDTEISDAEERVERIKRIAQIVDIISCNYQEQWYDMIHEAVPDKLILGTEVYQYFKGHRDQMQNFTDENPNLTALEKDYCIGSMIWTGYDYLGESMGWPAKGWSGAMIRTNLERRPSFYILQSYWSDEPMVHFSVMDYSLSDEGVKEHWDMPIYADHWHFPQFHKTLIPYMIASNCDKVALYLNGKQFHVPAPAQCTNRVITGFLPWQPGVVKVVGYRDGKEVCSQETRTPGPAVQLSFEQETVSVPAQEGYELLLSVHARDEDGNPYFRESAKVRFCVEGPGQIAGVDAGDIMSNEPYGEDSIHMYRGCASVVIRMDGTAGRVAVTAYVDGMRSARVIVCAE